MIIAKATLADAEQILALQKIAYLSEAEIYNDFSIHPLVQTLEEAKNDFSNQVILKIEESAKIIGSIRACEKNGTCYIGRLIVHPDYQNKGLGTALLNEIEAVFAASDRFELFTGHKSEKNLYLYKRLGYRIFKTQSFTDNLNLVYLEKNR